jgi:methylenetetrahydrofolate--tRNA-(uracil-5-)-methyltransferase
MEVMNDPQVIVIGGGIAGVEAAYQAAERGVRVLLQEMRPDRQTPMHRTSLLGELTGTSCFGVDALDRATGLMMAELRMLSSLVARAADETRIAKDSLFQVGRTAFAEYMTQAIEDHPLVEIERTQAGFSPGETPTVIATGPVTTSTIGRRLHRLANRDFHFYYGATEPLIDAATVDFSGVWRERRFEGTQPEHINCALDEGGYDRLASMLTTAPDVLPEGVGAELVFDAYTPLQVTLKAAQRPLYAGPLNPAGLTDPSTDEQPFAVCQLAPDETDGSVLRVANFACGVDADTQAQMLRCAHGLSDVSLVRHGQLHRGAFMPAQGLLDAAYRLQQRPNLFIVGSLCGLQGYSAVASSGWLAGVNAARLASGLTPVAYPAESLGGALCAELRAAEPDAARPLAVNFGMLPAAEDMQGTKEEKRAARAAQSLAALETLLRETSADGDTARPDQRVPEAER